MLESSNENYRTTRQAYFTPNNRTSHDFMLSQTFYAFILLLERTGWLVVKILRNVLVYFYNSGFAGAFKVYLSSSTRFRLHFLSKFFRFYTNLCIVFQMHVVPPICDTLCSWRVMVTLAVYLVYQILINVIYLFTYFYSRV